MGDPPEGALRQHVVLEHLLIRGFATVTGFAVAVAALVAVGLATFAVGTAEAFGLTGGRMTIELTGVPSGLEKPEQVSMLRATARSHDVDFVLMTPARDGASAAFDMYVLSGASTTPTFWTRATEHSASEIGDAVITWTYSVDGEPEDVAAFLRALRSAGYEFSVDELDPATVLLAAILSPGVAGVVLVMLAGLVIALVAESRRRRPRNRVRVLVGWSARRIAAHEGLESAGLAGACAVPIIGCLAVFAALRGASRALLGLLVPVTAALVGGVAVFVVVVHASLACIPERRRTADGRTTGHTAIVATVGVVLVALATSTGHMLLEQARTARALDRTLAAESASGDDVTLGVGFATESEDLALGAIGSAALERGTARMAMTNFMPGALLIAGASAEPSLADGTSQTRDGVTVLVPERLASDRPQIRAAVDAAVAGAWDVDDAAPTRRVPIDVQVVGSTAGVVQSAERWVTWLAPRDDGSDDLPVIVLHTLSDLAPNRFGTAVHNGEVRFSDRRELVHELRATSTIDVVTQINRVGATVERARAAARVEQTVVTGAAIGGGIAIVFAAVQLVGDHRRRTLAARRLRSIVGREPAATHVPFVTMCAGVSVAVVIVTASLTTRPVPLLVPGLIGLSAGLGVACILAVVLAATAHRDRIER